MGTRNFHWDPINDCVLMETDENSDTIVTYTHEPGQFGSLLSENRGGTEYYHHHDALGSTTMLTNDAGTVTDTFQYDAWGNVIERTGTTPTPYQWVGRWGYQFDSPTGDYYIRARVYQPTVARWMSVDPAGYLDGPNQYLYVRNNPTAAYDPSGNLCPNNPTNVTGMLPTGGSTDTTIAVQIQKIDFSPGNCGQFTWSIWWHIRDAAGAKGAYICQKLSLSLTLKDCAGKDIAATASPLITPRGNRITSITYWEAWGISAGENDTAARLGGKAPFDDLYSFPGVKCSIGQLKVKGEYTVIDGPLPIPPFKIRNLDTLAAGAPSSTTDPKVSPTPPITWRRHDITVDWDCCC